MKAKENTIAILTVVLMAGLTLSGCSHRRPRTVGATEVVYTESAQAKPDLELGSGKAIQIWRCELNGDTTEEQVLEGAQKWLGAAKALKGGKNLEMFVKFPVVVNSTGQVDLIQVLVAPTFKEWGQFWDAYGDSEAGDHEELSQAHMVCPDSTMWESFKVNPTIGAHPVDRTPSVPFSGGRAVQWWRCELVGDVSEEEVLVGAQKWLAAARKIKGGENLSLHVNFPVVVNATGQTDLLLMLVAPDFEKWGEFWDGYGDSEAGRTEQENHKILMAPDSVLWEGFRVKAP